MGFEELDARLARWWKNYRMSRLATRMRTDWDSRAKRNALHYVNCEKRRWDIEDFFLSGEQTVETEVRNDMANISQGKDPAEMRVLEIGCGAGRVTGALARVFGEVHAVDVSEEMVERAREFLSDGPNVSLYKNNGLDLSVLPDITFDFAFSHLVCQHIPSIEAIEGYLREVNRVLRPDTLFKFQVQGDPAGNRSRLDTWCGSTISEKVALQLAERCGFEARYRRGAETQYYWLWFFKRSG